MQIQQIAPAPEASVRPTLEPLVEEAWQLRDEDPARAQALAESLLERANDASGRAFTLVVQAFLAFRNERYDLALEQAFEAQSLFEEETSALWWSRLLNILANVYDELGERSLALEHFQKQLACAHENDIQEETFVAYHDLGIHFLSAGDSARGLEYLQKAKQHLPDDTRNRAFLEMSLAYCYAYRKQFEAAQKHAAASFALSGSNLRVLEMTLKGMAYVATKQCDHAEALRLYEESLRLLQDHRLSPALTLLNIAESQLALEHTQDALPNLERALTYLEQNGSKRYLADAHKLLSEVYKRGGAFERALEHYARFHTYHEAMFNENSETRGRALEVMHRTESFRQESALLKQKNESLERHNDELRKLHEKVHELSIRDPLTGLYNRRYLFEQVEQVFKFARRYEQPVSVAMLDIDHFKDVNDTLGHRIGDAVLARVGEVLRDALRQTDVTARYGGEEFAFVMPNTTLVDAAMSCERLRQLIREADWSTVHPALCVTVSIGLATSSALGPGEDEDLFVAADEQLYLAKRSGRNRLRF